MMNLHHGLVALGVWASLFFVAGCQPEAVVETQELKVLVGLQRTPCFGRCPVYELSVLNTGEATLQVGRFCEEAFGRSLSEGLHRSRVDIGLWRMVVDEAKNMGFDTLQSRYDNPRVTDLPAAVITIDGQSVFNRYGGPDLTELYARIERLVATSDWKPDPSATR